MTRPYFTKGEGPYCPRCSGLLRNKEGKKTPPWYCACGEWTPKWENRNDFRVKKVVVTQEAEQHATGDSSHESMVRVLQST